MSEHYSGPRSMPGMLIHLSDMVGFLESTEVAAPGDEEPQLLAKLLSEALDTYYRRHE